MIKIVVSAVALLIAVNQSSGSLAQPDCPSHSMTRVWTAISPAVVKTRVEPSWPNIHLNDTHGEVVLDAWIDESGNVSCVKITRSIPMNDQAAIDGVRQWKFAPATLRGTPVAVIQEVRVLKR
jgi:TonB family protein